MKKIVDVIFLFVSALWAQEEDDIQVYKSGFYLGASGVYPHYMTITEKSIATHKNFGFSFHLGYNITEHFGFRVSPHYLLLNSFWYGSQGEEQNNHVNMGTINIDAVYNILPCERISPFIILGYGFTYFKSSNPYLGPENDRIWIKESFTGNQLEFGLGAEFKFWDDVSIKAEANYITATNNKIDGNEHKNEVKGILQSNGDSYMNLSIGASWYFWRGEKSKICDPFTIREVITEIPVPVEKIIIDTDYIDNIIEKAVIEKQPFVLEKIKFKFDQDILTNEATLILQNVAKVLNIYPDEKFEIIGHTDSWGSDEYNLDLSKRRAASVKKYLMSQGVDSSRLFTSGCGEKQPVADNSTPEGRAINRRIEFSLYNGISNGCAKTSDLGSQLEGIKLNEEEEELAEKLIADGELTLNNIQFNYDSAELTEQAKKILINVSDVLKKLDTLNIEIQGHTDSDGSESYNQDLSDRRAASVLNFLVSTGIDSKRLSSKGYGESVPIADNKSEEGKAANRRIEFKIIK
jgi:outer membrane protein OmpA-like peptidoglycan-associated protein